MNAPSANPASLTAPHQNGTNGANGRVDLLAISELVTPGSRVLDIGCSDGELLTLLQKTRNVDGRGIEISQRGVNDCVARGLSVIQGDADSDLDAFPGDAFDVVVLSRTLQATRQPRHVLEALLRIGKRAIVSFPNFGFWRIRLGLLFRGQMPKSELLHNHWYDTPNIHLCTIRDFVTLCDELGARVERSLTLDRHGRPFALDPRGSLANMLAEQGMFVLAGKRHKQHH